MARGISGSVCQICTPSLGRFHNNRSGSCRPQNAREIFEMAEQAMQAEQALKEIISAPQVRRPADICVRAWDPDIF